MIVDSSYAAVCNRNRKRRKRRERERKRDIAGDGCKNREYISTPIKDR